MRRRPRSGRPSWRPASRRSWRPPTPSPPHGWWELTEPGARRFGVQGIGGRVFAPILTGSGHFVDQATAMHIVRNQPQRTRDDLLAKLMLVNLLKAQLAEDKTLLVGPLRMVVQQFAAPFIDHPDHPEYEPPEET
ncbi:DUF6221 family protein [Streptomyces lavendulocolor]|uniref:DUF6221 family protein n=1 Tax=Streptomyces lavendulocolor TaxID=67316 RepID=UPI0033E6D2E9